MRTGTRRKLAQAVRDEAQHTAHFAAARSLSRPGRDERVSAAPRLSSPDGQTPSPHATQLLADGRRPSRRSLECGRAAACVSKPELELASLEKPGTPRPRRFSVEPPTLSPFPPFARRRPPSVRRLSSPQPSHPTSVQLLSQPGAPRPCASFDPRVVPSAGSSPLPSVSPP